MIIVYKMWKSHCNAIMLTHYRSSLVSYPPELLIQIMKAIHADDDLQALCHTSKVFADICRDDWFWQMVLMMRQWSIDWPHPLHNGQALKPAGMEPKSFYIMLHRMAPNHRKNVLKLNNDTESIDRSMFFECDELQLNTLPPKLKSIEEYGFFKCTKLALIEFPNTLEIIGPRSFLYCKSLMISSLPSSITSIGEAAFRGCDFTLTALPPYIKTIKPFAFAECKNIAEIQLPLELERIETCAFLNCSNLKLQSLSHKLKIEDYSFYGCTKLMMNTQFRENIENINPKAFSRPNWLIQRSH